MAADLDFNSAVTRYFNLALNGLAPVGSTVTTGGAANGSPVSGNPVLVAGSDGTNARTLLTSATGQLVIVGANSTSVGVVGNVASGSADSGNPMKIGGLTSTTVPSGATTGQRKDMWVGAVGNPMVGFGVGGGSLTGVNAPQIPLDAVGTARALAVGSYGSNGTSLDAFKTMDGLNGSGTGVQAIEHAGALFNNISTATTTTVKSGTGTFHRLIVGTAVASATVTIYNNTTATGAKIATITFPSTVANPYTLDFDLWFSLGLTIVTSGASDITAVYR
jgi:hypothetical protein